MVLTLVVGMGMLIVSLLIYSVATVLILKVIVGLLRKEYAGISFWKNFVLMMFVTLATALVHLILHCGHSPFSSATMRGHSRTRCIFPRRVTRRSATATWSFPRSGGYLAPWRPSTDSFCSDCQRRSCSPL
jgi:hypothetical protein